MARPRKQKIDATVEAPALNSPFAALAGLRDQLPEGEAAGPTAAAESAHSATAPGPDRFAAKLVVWSERKGRAGKTVTLVRGVLLRGAELEAFLKQLRSALGTRAQLEDACLVLGGDQRERAAAWLRQQGARRVVLGN